MFQSMIPPMIPPDNRATHESLLYVLSVPLAWMLSMVVLALGMLRYWKWKDGRGDR